MPHSRRRREQLEPFELSDLKILVGIGEGRTQAEIGMRLRIEQPAISKRIRGAEKRAGLHLVSRNGRYLALTESGAKVATLAAEILANYEALSGLCNACKSDEGGKVRILASGTPASYVLPDFIASYMSGHPDVRVDLDVRTVARLWQAFNNGDYDFAIVPLAKFPSEATAESLYQDRLVLFVNPQHPLAKASEIVPGDLRDLTLTSKFRPKYWPNVFDGLQRLGFTPANHIEFLSFEGVKRMVTVNSTIGMLFESSLHRELERGEFVQLPVCESALVQSFCLLRRSDAVPTRDAIELRNFLIEHLKASRFILAQNVPTSYWNLC